MQMHKCETAQLLGRKPFAANPVKLLVASTASAKPQEIPFEWLPRVRSPDPKALSSSGKEAPAIHAKPR